MQSLCRNSRIKQPLYNAANQTTKVTHISRLRPRINVKFSSLHPSPDPMLKFQGHPDSSVANRISWKWSSWWFGRDWIRTETFHHFLLLHKNWLPIVSKLKGLHRFCSWIYTNSYHLLYSYFKRHELTRTMFSLGAP